MLESADALVMLGVRRVFQKLKSKCTEGDRLGPACAFTLKRLGLEVYKDRHRPNEYHVVGSDKTTSRLLLLPKTETQRQARFYS